MDEEKAVSNFSKHKVSFEAACEVFFDPFIVSRDAEFIDDEIREIIIGATVNLRLL